MKRFLFLSLGILFSILFVGLSAPYSASAQSVYDDWVLPTNELSIIQGSRKIEGINGKWLQIFSKSYSLPNGLEYSTSTSCDFNVDQADYWAVSQMTSSSGKRLRLLYSPTPSSAYSTFGNSPEQLNAVYIPSEVVACEAYFGSTGRLVVQDYTYTGATITGKATQSTTFEVFLSTFPVDYPPGYQGPQIPATYSPPTSPEFKFNYDVADKKITLYDISDFSLGQTICKFQISPNGTQVFTELYFDCDTKQSVTYNVDEYGKYDVILIYLTADYDLYSSTTITIDIDGSTFSDTYGYTVNQTFYKCIYSELPFINFTECWNNVLIFAGMLSFNSLQFGTDFTPPDGCRNLVVLGDWIGAPSNTVCPMIPPFIRDVTTPFVTFLLGLLMLKFITSRGGGGFS